MTKDEETLEESTMNPTNVIAAGELAKKLQRLKKEEERAREEWDKRLTERFAERRSKLLADVPEEVRRIAGVES